MNNVNEISNMITIESMKNLFQFCNFSLIKFPDISKWNIEKVRNMSGLFSFGSFKDELPAISNWNTKNVTDISEMFTSYKKIDYLIFQNGK